jgi:hypothetical protein
LYVVHPGASHTVLYLGGLSEILSVIFFLGCLLAIPDPGSRAAPNRHDPSRRQTVWIGVLAALSMLSKEAGFLLPIVVGLMMLDARVEAGTRRKVYKPVLFGAAIAVLWRGVAHVATPESLTRSAIDPMTSVPYLKRSRTRGAGAGGAVLLRSVSPTSTPGCWRRNGGRSWRSRRSRIF